MRQHLRDVLPASTVRTLDPYFRRAREVLASNPDAKMARWPGKVRVVPRGLPQVSPTVRIDVQRAVYTALLEERRIAVQYRKRGASQDTDYEVSPLGLVLRNGALLLVCTFWDYDDVNQMLLHRMSRAELLDRSAKRRPGFDVDAYIAAGHPFARSSRTGVSPARG